MAENRYLLNAQLAQMLKGGVIMDVANAEQAPIAQEAGAVAVMALERVPADIRKQGGVARMSNRADQRDQGGRNHPGHGQGAHRPFRGSAGFGSARRRLHRRKRSTNARRRRMPHRQDPLRDSLRVRGAQSGRGAAAARRGRGDDPHQGRGRHRQRGRGGAPHAHHEPGNPPTATLPARKS